MVAINPKARPLGIPQRRTLVPREAKPRFADRFERASYLANCYQVSDELVQLGGFGAMVHDDADLDNDETEPAEPSPAEEARLAAAIADCCESIRKHGPEKRKVRDVSSADVGTVKRLLALPGMSKRKAANLAGLDEGTVAKIARGESVRMA